MRNSSRRLAFGAGMFILLVGSNPLWAEQGRGHAKASHAGKHGDKDGAGHGEGRDPAAYFQEHGHSRLHIPPGHYPGPGECRIWYPGRPPGHQPPPTKCSRVGRVPPGAWVLRHPGDREHVHVAVYDERRPNTILVVGEFRITDGIFVRVVVDR